MLARTAVRNQPSRRVDIQNMQQNNYNNDDRSNQVQSLQDSATFNSLLGLFLRLLEKSYWIIAAAIIGATLAGVYSYRNQVPMYSATSKIYIASSDTSISISDLQLGSYMAPDYQEVFKTWHLHEMVDQKLGLNYSYGRLASMVSVDNPAGTHVLYITVRSTDPVECKTLADAYADVTREFIAAKMDMREPTLFEEARVPAAPYGPNRTRTITIGLLMGALFAAGIIALFYWLDDRIRTQEDVSKCCNMPNLGMVPLQEGQKKDPDEGHHMYGRRRLFNKEKK